MVVAPESHSAPLLVAVAAAERHHLGRMLLLALALALAPAPRGHGGRRMRVRRRLGRLAALILVAAPALHPLLRLHAGPGRGVGVSGAQRREYLVLGGVYRPGHVCNYFNS